MNKTEEAELINSVEAGEWSSVASLIPGINGGYYLVRVCALIEHGQLALI
ncbi:MAG: hypothetical protein ACOYOE_11150 [Chlorobium sp.]